MVLNILKNFKKNKKAPENTLVDEQERTKDKVEKVVPAEEISVIERHVSCYGWKNEHLVRYYHIKEWTDRVTCEECNRIFVLKK